MLERCRRAVDAGVGVFLLGEHGVGKTALAKRICDGRTGDEAIYLPHCSPVKELLCSLLMECWRRGVWELPDGAESDEASVEKKVRRFDQKAALTQAVKALQNAGKSQKPVVIIDEFEGASASVVRACRHLAPHATLIVCGASEKPGQRPFLFGFEKIEVARLSKSESEELATRLLGEFQIAEGERGALLRHVVEAAQGLPRVIHELVSRAAKRGDVSLRGVRREEVHGHTTVDMTPALIIGACFLLALRYAVRGLGDADLPALAGISAAGFMVLRFYAYRMSRPQRAAN